MASNAFVVKELRELIVLQRVFREAKFCPEPDDQEISGSPVVAELFNRLMEVIISAEVDRFGDGAREKWIDWLTIDEDRYEWGIAVGRARVEPDWARLTIEEKLALSKDLLSPFIVSLDLLERFIKAVDKVSGE